jgi:hypothetical protein
MDLSPEYIKVGDTIKAATTCGVSTRRGQVLRREISGEGKHGYRLMQPDGTPVTVLDHMRTYTGGIEGEPQVGDIIIGSPDYIGGTLRAEVIAVRPDSSSFYIRAKTLDALVPSSNGRSTDLSRGYGYSQDKFTIVQRPEPKASAPEPQDLTDRYPTLYHLKAAIWDLARAKYKANDWCDDVNDVLLGLGVNRVTNVVADNCADQVRNLISGLQNLWTRDLGISLNEYTRVLTELGIEPKPQTKRVQLELEVPAHLTLGDVQAMIHASSPDTIVHRNQEVPR